MQEVAVNRVSLTKDVAVLEIGGIFRKARISLFLRPSALLSCRVILNPRRWVIELLLVVNASTTYLIERQGKKSESVMRAIMKVCRQNGVPVTEKIHIDSEDEIPYTPPIFMPP